MLKIKNKSRFYVSALLYLVFNLKIYRDFMSTALETAVHLLETAPFVAGITYCIVAILQALGDGSKVPWENRLRLFFAIGIITGLILAIWQYAGVDFEQYQPRTIFSGPEK